MVSKVLHDLDDFEFLPFFLAHNLCQRFGLAHGIISCILRSKSSGWVFRPCMFLTFVNLQRTQMFMLWPARNSHPHRCLTADSGGLTQAGLRCARPGFPTVIALRNAEGPPGGTSLRPSCSPRIAPRFIIPGVLAQGHYWD